MDLTVRDVARLLELPEEDVYRLAARGELPASRIQDQYQFNQVEILEWAALHRHRVAPDLCDSSGTSMAVAPSQLADAMERGGFHYGVAGTTRDLVLKSISELPGIPAGVDRPFLHQLLLSREALSSTAVGEGLALPHPRDPLVFALREPVVPVCFLARPVDFGAPDGVPVRLLFTLLSPSIKLHLKVLARLSYALHDARLRALLAAAAPSDLILERAREIEREAPASGGRDET